MSLNVIQVLPDGRVVKINQTVIADTSDDGSSFFFHSTSYHNVGDAGTSDEDEDEYGIFEHEFTPIDEV